MPVVKPPIRYRFRSAITGRWVRMTTWKRWPKWYIRERVKPLVPPAEDDFPDDRRP